VSIKRVFEEMQGFLQPVLSAAGEKIPTFGLGATELHRHNAIPRIVWVPVRSRVSGPMQQGGNPRALWTREVEVMAQVWHHDFAAVENLMNHMVAAMTRAVGGAYKPIGERWDVDKDLDAGTFAELTMTLLIPFTDEPQRTAVPTTAPLTGEIVGSV